MNRRAFLSLSVGMAGTAVAGCTRNRPSTGERIQTATETAHSGPRAERSGTTTDGAATIPAGGRQSIDIDGVPREYILDVPSTYENGAGDLTPLVVCLHGGGGSAKGFRKRNGFVDAGDREDFVVVHPDGKGLTGESFHVWNIGYVETRLSNADDYRFIARLVDHLTTRMAIDKQQIFLVGHSMGAMLAHEIGARFPDRFASIAPVAGTLGGYPCESPDKCTAYTPPEPTSPVSVLTVNGTADEHVLYDGGPPKEKIRRQPRYDFSVQKTIDWWREQTGCTAATPGTSEALSERVHRSTYVCSGPNTVEHLRFEGVGHFWAEFDAALATTTNVADSLASLLWRRLRETVATD